MRRRAGLRHRRPLSRRELLAWFGASAALAAVPTRAVAFGEDSLFDMPLVRYDAPSWNPRPTAIRRLLLELEMTTSVEIVREPAVVEFALADLVETPLVVLAGDREFPSFDPAAREALRAFLAAGGLLFVDSCEGRADGAFADAVRREIAECLPDAPLAPLPADHVLYRSFYLVEPGPGRLQVADLEGAVLDDRLAVVFSQNDLLGAWARDNYGNWEFEMHPGGDRQRQMAIRFGVNLAMYALCLDYKEDQVHVNYLLRRRRWHVD